MGFIVDLADVDASSIALVGGKAAGLGELIKAGESVPSGFCITTEAHAAGRASSDELPEDLHREIVRAYERLGAGAVAVRSSSTAEDLPHASFAGQHVTQLNVTGAEALIDAVRRCWESLSAERVVVYRQAAGIAGQRIRMGVVVQRMVDAAAAGVLFTANPITGTRTEMVVDAVAGLGDVVVDGRAAADHYVLADHRALIGPSQAAGCLSPAQLGELREAGERLQRRAGAPQDIEFAFDHGGTLWLLQSRPITTLFPVPQSSRPGPRVYFEVGHMQGMLRPFTPMGMSAMRVATSQYFASISVPADPFDGHPGMIAIAGRIYLDLTGYVRSTSTRTRLPAFMKLYGPRVSAAMERVLQDPRFTPVHGRPYRLHTALRVTARVAPGLIAGVVTAIIFPARARSRAFRCATKLRDQFRPRQDRRTAAEHVRFAMELQRPFMTGAIMTMLPPLYAAILARLAAVALLSGVATESEIDETLRGMPYNVTTEMDLTLWRLAIRAREHRDLLLNTPPAELAERYLAGELPEIGLGEFLRRFGHRGAAEVDVGVPRWAEDPAPVFAAIAGYLRATNPEHAADRRFARAAQDATAKIDELVARARRARPVRATVAGFFLRRCRALAGLRELPKFVWLYAFAEIRRQLLAAGAELRERGVLERADDIMFLDFREALAVTEPGTEGSTFRRRIAARRADHERETRRRNVPGLLLSDGANPEALTPSRPAPDGALVGLAAAPGSATGKARVIHDPAGAQVEPGEILVAPTTDPGWTPLFMTAGGLVTETGSPMAHGPTVAREYGIPAVICVRDATRLISTGEMITIDGAAGTVMIDRAGADAPAPSGKSRLSS